MEEDTNNRTGQEWTHEEEWKLWEMVEEKKCSINITEVS